MSNGSGLSTTEVLRPVSRRHGGGEGDPDRGRRAGLPAATVDRTGALAHFSLIDTMIPTCIHSVGHVAEPSHFFDRFRGHELRRAARGRRGPRAGAADGGRNTADPRASARPTRAGWLRSPRAGICSRTARRRAPGALPVGAR